MLQNELLQIQEGLLVRGLGREGGREREREGGREGGKTSSHTALTSFHRSTFRLANIKHPRHNTTQIPTHTTHHELHHTKYHHNNYTMNFTTLYWYMTVFA